MGRSLIIKFFSLVYCFSLFGVMLNRKLVWCLPCVVLKVLIQKKRRVKNKKKYRIFMHALVEKMLIKFIAVFIGKVLLDARW